MDADHLSSTRTRLCLTRLLDQMESHQRKTKIADEGWLEAYNKRQQEKKERLERLNNRFTRKQTISNWCSCGNCKLDLLHNAKECCCCRDFPECIDALNDVWVLQEFTTARQCITLHPAYNNTCLERWSLRLSAGKYRTIDKRAYKQTKSEEAFLRSVAYREFIHLVYDKVGKNRIPLPAYHTIRKKFKPKDNASFTGFLEDESDTDT